MKRLVLFFCLTSLLTSYNGCDKSTPDLCGSGHKNISYSENWIKQAIGQENGSFNQNSETTDIVKIVYLLEQGGYYYYLFLKEDAQHQKTSTLYDCEGQKIGDGAYQLGMGYVYSSSLQSLITKLRILEPIWPSGAELPIQEG